MSILWLATAEYVSSSGLSPKGSFLLHSEESATCILRGGSASLSCRQGWTSSLWGHRLRLWPPDSCSRCKDHILTWQLPQAHWEWGAIWVSPPLSWRQLHPSHLPAQVLYISSARTGSSGHLQPEEQLGKLVTGTSCHQKLAAGTSCHQHENRPAKENRSVNGWCIVNQEPFLIWGLLSCYVNFRIIFSNSVKNVMGNLIGVALNFQFALGSMAALTIVILPIQEHGLSFHFFKSY